MPGGCTSSESSLCALGLSCIIGPWFEILGNGLSSLKSSHLN